MNMAVAAAVAALVLTIGGAKADPAAVRATIKAQLEAFRAKDAVSAFSHAGPRIKEMFGTPERFIEMVRRGYRPVYQATEPTFLRFKSAGEGGVAQEVGLVDDAGEAWTALYTLKRRDDGSWRITGCYLRKADGKAA